MGSALDHYRHFARGAGVGARPRLWVLAIPYYVLADTPEGQAKQAEVERREPSSASTYGDIRQGFVYKRVPHITLRAIANNAEIDVIWERMQPAVEAAVGRSKRGVAGHSSRSRGRAR